MNWKRILDLAGYLIHVSAGHSYIGGVCHVCGRAK